MKAHLSTSSSSAAIMQEMKYSFDRDFFVKSKPVMITMAFAFLYCLGYGIILFFEFKKMGILN